MNIGQILTAIGSYPQDLSNIKVFEVKYYSIAKALFDSDPKKFKDSPANNTVYHACPMDADENEFKSYLRQIHENKDAHILDLVRSIKQVDKWPDFHPGGIYMLPLVKGKE